MISMVDYLSEFKEPLPEVSGANSGDGLMHRLM